MFRAKLHGEDYKKPKQITDYPQGFKDWCKDNADKIKETHKKGKDPYFVRHNMGVVRRLVANNDITQHHSSLSPNLKEISKDFRNWAKENLVGNEYEVKGLGRFIISNRTIKENCSYGSLLHARIDVITHLNEYLPRLEVKQVPIEHNEKNNIKAFYEGEIKYTGNLQEIKGRSMMLQFKQFENGSPILYFVKFV